MCIYEDRKDRARIEQVMRGGEKEQGTERCGWKGAGGEMGNERKGKEEEWREVVERGKDGGQERGGKGKD